LVATPGTCTWNFGCRYLSYMAMKYKEVSDWDLINLQPLTSYYFI